MLSTYGILAILYLLLIGLIIFISKREGKKDAIFRTKMAEVEADMASLDKLEAERDEILAFIAKVDSGEIDESTLQPDEYGQKLGRLKEIENETMSLLEDIVKKLMEASKNV